jgi:hypothetical protein
MGSGSGSDCKSFDKVKRLRLATHVHCRGTGDIRTLKAEVRGIKVEVEAIKGELQQVLEHFKSKHREQKREVDDELDSLLSFSFDLASRSPKQSTIRHNLQRTISHPRQSINQQQRHDSGPY